MVKYLIVEEYVLKNYTGKDMENFVFENSTRFYFGKGQLEDALERELTDAATVMVAYGGGSVKRTGLFDRIAAALPVMA